MKKTTTQVNVEGVFDVQCVKKAEHRHYFCQFLAQEREEKIN